MINFVRIFQTLLLTLFVLIPPSTVFAADDTVDKTVCKLAVGYQDVDEIQADLLAAAKREVINELFGEMIVASTAVENFVVTSDQIRTSSIGFVRVDGNAEFFNGKGFAEVCVTIQAYVTEEDRAKFIPEKLEKKYCDADEDMTTAQLIAYVKEEAVIQSLIEYNPKLKGADKESLLQLVQKVSYLESGFIPDTQTYCVTFEGEVVPVEITAFLETSILQVLPTGSSGGTQSANPTPTISSDLVEIAVDGITASSRNNVYYNPDNASDGDEKTAWIGGSSYISEEWIEVVFRSPKTISRIGLYRQQNPERAQVKAARLVFSDGSYQEVTFKGLAGWNYVDIDPITTDSVKLEISEVNPIGGYVEIVDLTFLGVETESKP